MRKPYYTATISTHFITALINADTSGLTKQDLKDLEDWEIINEVSHVYGPECTDTSFERCDITGLYSDCIEIQFEIKSN